MTNYNQYNNNPVPTRVDPMTEPLTEPMRRLEPDKLCPNQKGRVSETVRRVLRP